MVTFSAVNESSFWGYSLQSWCDYNLCWKWSWCMISAAKHPLYALLLFQCTKHGNIKVCDFIDSVCKVRTSCLLYLSCLNHKKMIQRLVATGLKPLVTWLRFYMRPWMLRLFKDWLIRKCMLCILAISYEQGKNHKKQFTTGQVYSDCFLHFLHGVG